MSAQSLVRSNSTLNVARSAGARTRIGWPTKSTPAGPAVGGVVELVGGEEEVDRRVVPPQAHLLVARRRRRRRRPTSARPPAAPRNVRSASAGATNRLMSTSRVPAWLLGGVRQGQRAAEGVGDVVGVERRREGDDLLDEGRHQADRRARGIGRGRCGRASASCQDLGQPATLPTIVEAAGPRRLEAGRANEVEEHVGAWLAAAVLVRAQHARGDADPPSQLDLGEPGAATDVAQRGGGVHEVQVSGSAQSRSVQDSLRPGSARPHVGGSRPRPRYAVGWPPQTSAATDVARSTGVGAQRRRAA